MKVNVIDLVLTRIAAKDPREVSLEDPSLHSGTMMYRVRCGERTAFVDRVLAIELRSRGARWTGAIGRDPCAVA